MEIEIKIRSIGVDSQSIIPTLKIYVDFEFIQYSLMPLSITGQLLIGNKIAAFLNEYEVYDKEFYLHILSREQIQNLYNKKNGRSIYTAELSAVLSRKAIEHVEAQREKDQEKSVKCVFKFAVKYLELDRRQANETGESLMHFLTKQQSGHFEIKQSDWIRNYVPKLGIGNFMLLELRIPDAHIVTKSWLQLYSKLSENLKKMEKSLQEGDWEKTITIARKYYDIINLRDSKPTQKTFKIELGKLLEKAQYSSEAITNFHTGIQSFFDFLSKHLHDMGKDGEIHASPKAAKEYAYFAYALALGLLNIIGKTTEEPT